MRGISRGVLLFLLCGCDPATGSLAVQVRCDLAPQVEFTSIEVVVLQSGAETMIEQRTFADVSRNWSAGVRVAELPAVRAGAFRAHVRAWNAGTIVIERPVSGTIEADAETVVTVLLTRDCLGVACPTPGDGAAANACIGGRCVHESCYEESGSCTRSACSSAAECAAPVAECATIECTPSGTCFPVLDREVCGPGRSWLRRRVAEVLPRIGSGSGGRVRGPQRRSSPSSTRSRSCPSKRSE